ncbi:DNA polymerase III subunit beta [Acidiferrobacter sp.]|uniref:DNA polymerase III subunit beta n=1 Tax=Acidiferrobacter sp. TaxID=1872107 RepID=UPI002627AC22|nr:DNA polymerase III subunit beta [Acidiferrobacter sp.]
MTRDDLLKALSVAGGVVERRQSQPILTHVLMEAGDGEIVLTGTDLEVEVVARCPAQVSEPGKVTVPGRKFLDIVRTLPAESVLQCQIDAGRFRVVMGKSRFQLATLPVDDFPNLMNVRWDTALHVARADMRRVLEKTQFCMAQQDVRYYLNGVMLEMAGRSLRAVGADGHRLAFCATGLNTEVAEERQVIVPRKAIGEMTRFLGDTRDPIELSLSANHIRVTQDQVVFVSKLVDGRFPDYHRVIPQTVKYEVVLGRAAMLAMLGRVGVVSTEKFRGIRLRFQGHTVAANATNVDRDEAWEELETDGALPEMETGFNVSYLVEAISALEEDEFQFGWSDNNGAVRLKAAKTGDDQVYVVMPVRL